ncbi:RNA-directed DNA polymerase, eukaryota, reverse transcriptase zinc-binding domain protein [Tanacetum coccineum]
MKPIMNKLNWKNRNLCDTVKKLKSDLDTIQISIDNDPHNESLRRKGVDILGEYSVALEDEEKLMFQRAKVPIQFVNHFKSFLGPQQDMECLEMDSRIFKNKIDLQSACDMIRKVTREEIKDAMFSIDDNKALGPDGYTAKFFKKAWNIIGNDVCRAVEEFFLSGKLLGELNATLITLVPKITDNILLTQELLKGYDCAKGPKRCSMKIDIQKAYDTVNWTFLENALRMFGFHSKRVNWIMTCVSTLSYSICINGDRYRYFRGGRGLRQGDLMSPYLFTMVMEVFNLVLKQKISEENKFKYHFGCKKLQITHLYFAGDLLVLYHRDSTSVKVIKSALEDFSKISGLHPNLGKSTIFYGSMDNIYIANVLNILPFKRGKLLVRYLGVPLVSKKLGVKDCKGLIDKVKTRAYWASVFKLPKAVIKDIERIFKGFLWNRGELQKGKDKVSWKNVCQPKKYGGLGFNPLEQWNSALLIKHLWNVANKKDTLWIRWIHLINLWKSLMDLKDGVRSYMQYKVGNGYTISMWHDSWSLLPTLDTIVSKRKIYAAEFSNDASVADCIDNNGWMWLAQWFIDHPILNQYTVHILNENMEDKLMWCSKDGSIKNFTSYQAFVLWIASKEKLVTQDKLAQWYPNKSWKRPLCLKIEDSHKHLYFECDFSKLAWEEVQDIMNVKNLSNLSECLHKLASLPCKNSNWSIVRRLCIADIALLFAIRKVACFGGMPTGEVLIVGPIGWQQLRKCSQVPRVLVTCRSIDIANMILDESFAQLYDDDAVSLCCLGILQLVILCVESRRVVPDWMLRLENDRALKTWILESYRVTVISYFDRYNRYPRVAKGRFLGPMVIPFFEVRKYACSARLTPDDNEARSDWWISSRAYFDALYDQVERVPFDLSRQNMYEIPSDIYREFDEQKREIERNKKEVDNMKEEMRKFREEMNVQPVRTRDNEPLLAVSTLLGHVNSSYFNMGTPPNFQTPMQSQPGSSVWQRQMPAHSATQYWQPDTSSQPGSYYSFGQVPFHMGRQNLQTTIETHDDVDGIFYQNIPNRERRDSFSLASIN